MKHSQSVAYGLSFRACAISFAAPKAIAFTTLGQLCAFFHCSPNDLLVVDWEGEEIAPPTADEIEKASQIMKQAFACAEAMPPRSTEEIWDSFEGTIERISSIKFTLDFPGF